MYVVHSSDLFGTERMALETLQGFRGEYDPVMICPQGPLVDECAHREIPCHLAKGPKQLFSVFRTLLQNHSSLILMTTALSHALVFSCLNVLYRRRVSHLHLVHGGADERDSYGRKKYLNHFRVTLVAVSEFVAGRLRAHGVRADRIQVVGNFLTRETLATIQTRPPFEKGPLLRGIVISRLIPRKRVDLIFDALERHQDLKDFSFVMYGLGGRRKMLTRRAQENGLAIELPGFADNLHQITKDFDFLLHMCPDEPFGLVVLEAMAAGIPVLVPDQGGVLAMVRHGENGFLFKANDPDALADALRQLRDLPVAEINRTVERARNILQTEFSSQTQVAAYRAVIEAGW